MNTRGSGLAQLPLGITGPQPPRLADFLPGPNGEALRAVERLARGGAGCIYLWGARGSGRTHLLQGACGLAAENGSTAGYLPLREWETLSPDIVEGMERLALVALDDVDAVTGRPAWERALFNLYNGALESGAALLMAGAAPPAALALQLEDLRSRLSWGLILQLRNLDDSEKAEVLRQRAQARGLELPAEVADYLLRRAPRDLAALCRMLDALDQASLAAQRRLTVPFVKAWLADEAG